MKKVLVSITLLSCLSFWSCKNEVKETTPDTATETTESTKESTEKEKSKPQLIKQSTGRVSLKLEPKSDTKATGRVQFVESEGIVVMEAKLSGLEPGIHAIHIHEKADCSSADGKSSGGHWNPTFQPHGKWGAEEGYHKGDIGNFEVNKDGVGKISFKTDEWCIGCEDPNKDIIGKAIVVHQGTDDFTSQPSGAAGARVSCGGIIE